MVVRGECDVMGVSEKVARCGCSRCHITMLKALLKVTRGGVMGCGEAAIDVSKSTRVASIGDKWCKE